MKRLVYGFAALSSFSLSGCGTYVPLKDPLHENNRLSNNHSREGQAESNIIANIRCEIQKGLYEASIFKRVAYLGEDWGTQVTLKLTWDEISGLTPGIAHIDPISAAESFAVGFGGSASAHATRLETITFLFENHALLEDARKNVAAGYPPDCSKQAGGFFIESDLKIDEFIYDKATIADNNIATTEDPSKPQFSTFQEDLTFVASFGGSITPTWKLTRLTANSTGTLASATRTATGDVLITLGALARDSKTGKLLPRLGDTPAAQHNAGVTGGSTASQINGLTHY